MSPLLHILLGGICRRQKVQKLCPREPIQVYFFGLILRQTGIEEVNRLGPRGENLIMTKILLEITQFQKSLTNLVIASNETGRETIRGWLLPTAVLEEARLVRIGNEADGCDAAMATYSKYSTRSYVRHEVPVYRWNYDGNEMCEIRSWPSSSLWMARGSVRASEA